MKCCFIEENANNSCVILFVRIWNLIWVYMKQGYYSTTLVLKPTKTDASYVLKPTKTDASYVLKPTKTDGSYVWIPTKTDPTDEKKRKGFDRFWRSKSDENRRFLHVWIRRNSQHWYIGSSYSINVRKEQFNPNYLWKFFSWWLISTQAQSKPWSVVWMN